MNATEGTKFKNAEEKVKLAVMASQGKEGKLDKNLLKENVNNIDGIEEKVEEVTYDLVIKVDGYEFLITELGNISVKDNKQEELIKRYLSYRFKNNNFNETKQHYAMLTDTTGNNNNANLYDMEISDDKDGMNFNGESSYAQLNLQKNLEFPLTIETTIKCSEKMTNSLIYLEPGSKTALGIYNGHFCVTINTSSRTVTVPSDFYNGTLKHIVVTYTSLTEFEMYINGIKMTKNSSTDAWTSGIGTISYLGRRSQGNYFNGTLYNFRIYEKLLTEEEIISSYENDINVVNNNATNINRSNLILEYTIKNNDDNISDYSYLYKAKDMSNDNDAILYNISQTEKEDGIVFNGTSSYAQLNLQKNLEFPLTIEAIIKCSEEMTNSLIYLEPGSKTALGIYNGRFNVTINTNSKTVTVPSDFYNGTLKHIVVTYTSLTDFEMYINGVKMIKDSLTESWTSGIGTISYLGRRSQGNYFKGVMYEFNIYEQVLEKDKIESNYQEIINNYE